MQRHLKLYRLPETTKIEGIRKLKVTDIPEACKLLNEVGLTVRFLYRYANIATVSSTDVAKKWPPVIN